MFISQQTFSDRQSFHVRLSRSLSGAFALAVAVAFTVSPSPRKSRNGLPSKPGLLSLSVLVSPRMPLGCRLFQTCSHLPTSVRDSRDVICMAGHMNYTFFYTLDIRFASHNVNVLACTPIAYSTFMSSSSFLSYGAIET